LERAIERVEPDIRFVGDQKWQPFARLLASLTAGELDAVTHGYGIVSVLDGLGGLQIDAGARDANANLDKLVAGRGRFYIGASCTVSD